MNKPIKTNIAVAIAAACLAMAVTDARADDDSAAKGQSAGGGLEEVLITAQKRSENLQETPISISVLTSDDLVNRHVQSLLDLGDGAIPSLRVAPFFSRPGALIINARGIGVLSDSNQPARDQGVGVYIDGIYLGRAQGLGAALYDIENIEVLKGPQGTLFGRNTEGGAVNIVTKRPSGMFKMNTSFGVANYGGYKGETHIDLPEFANVSFKVDAVVSSRDGFVVNPLPGAEDFNSFNKRGLHIESLWQPMDGFKADLSYDTSYDATSTLYYQQLTAGTGLPAAASGSPAVLANSPAALFRLQPTRASTAAVGSPQQPSVGETDGVRLGLDWELMPKLTLKSITSYRELTQSQYDNGSGASTLQQATASATVTPSFLNFQFSRYSLAQFGQHQGSQEFQLIGETDRIKYATGALYYEEKVTDNAQAFNTNQFTDAAGSAFVIRQLDYAAQVIQRASRVKTTSVGVYGQATYTPAIADDNFHLTVGGRWTRDKKDGQLFMVNGALPVVPVNGVNVSGPVVLDTAWSRFDPLVNLAYDIDANVHVYGKWSTGYRSGGANSRSLNSAQFNPEKVAMFEVGAKTEFWDRRARLNVSAYSGDYDGIQLDFSGLYEDVINGVRVATTRTTTNTVNAPGTGKLKGAEIELTVAPMERLTLTASYAYNSVEIPNTVNPFPQTGGVFITTPIPIYQVYTPKYAASAAIDYELPYSSFTVRLHLDGNYDNGYYGNYTDSEYDTVTRAVRYAQPKGDSALVFNGRLAIADIDLGQSKTKLVVGLWARNLFNEEHVFYKSGSPRSGVQGFFNDPRTFGIEANFKY